MSVSSVSLKTDVNVRYERLTSEYSKLLAQAKVLRDGVLTERQKNQKLTEELTAKDISIRKLTTENESLSFRNEQLAKRVEGFQIEVEYCRKKEDQKSSKKSKAVPADVVGSIQTMNSRIHILEEELANKLHQYEELVGKFAEQERIHNEELNELSIKFRTEINNLEDQLRERNSSMKDRYYTNTARNLPHIETSHYQDENGALEYLPSPSLLSFPEDVHCHLMDSVRASISDVANLFQLLSQRCELYPFDASMEQLPPHFLKLSSVFGQCCPLLNSCVIILDSSIERKEWNTPDDTDAFIHAFSLFCRHCSGLIPDLLIATCESENKVTWGDSRLEELNIEWRNTFTKFLTMMSTLSVHLESRISNNIVEHFKNLPEVVRALAESFRARWSLESRFPSANRRIVCVCEAITDCLTLFHCNVVKLNARLAAFNNLSKNGLIVECSQTTDNDEMITPTKGSQSEMNGHFFNGVSTACMTSPIPTVVPTCEKCVTLSHNDESIERKSSEISHLVDRLAQLESEREGHLVDLSLLRHKINLAGGHIQTEVMNDADHVSKFTKYRLKELMNEKQKIMCSAHYYKTECTVLLRKMRNCQDQKSLLEEEIAVQEKKNSELEDELASVRRGYELQLSSMTEHVADLSEKLASIDVQKDKSTISTKGFARRSFFK